MDGLDASIFHPPLELVQEEITFQARARVEVPKTILYDRVEALIGTFMQQAPVLESANVLEDVVSSMVVIGDLHRRSDDFSDPFWYVDEHRARVCARYVLDLDSIQVMEGSLQERGYLDRAILLKLGTGWPLWNKIKNADLAADAVAAMYLKRCRSYGTLEEGDDRKLWIAKHFPLIQGRKTRGLALRLGNEAAKLEEPKIDAGLQFIYDITQK